MRSNAKTVFKNLKRKVDKVMADAPRVLANEGVKSFTENFKNQGFEGNSWRNVERRIVGTNAYKYPKKKDLGRRTRPILIGKTRNLRNATVNSVRIANKRRIVWGNYLPYAEVQNDARPFMANGSKFRKRLKNKYESMFKFIK